MRDFADAKILFDDDGGYLGILTPDGIEAAVQSGGFIMNRRVLSTKKDVRASIRRILVKQLGLELPEGFTVDIQPEDLAVFCSQMCSLEEMEQYISEKRELTAKAADIWRVERPWDTKPMTLEQATAINLVFDPEKGSICSDGCFNPLTRLELPSSVDGQRVTYIKMGCCASYTYIDTLIIPDSVTAMDQYAFYDKVHMTNARLSKNLKVVPDDAFCRCRSIKTVIMPEGIEEIHDEAFKECSSLYTTVPSSVRYVGRCAFLKVPHIYYYGSAKGFPWGATLGN